MMREPDHVPEDFARDFAELMRDETTLPVHTTRLRLWCLMGVIQLASRHPEAMQSTPVRIAVEMARHIQRMVATTPALARVAEQGWDQTLDFVSSSPQCRWCGRRTSHPTDIAERYCPCCGGWGLLRGCEHRPTETIAEYPWDQVAP